MTRKCMININVSAVATRCIEESGATIDNWEQGSVGLYCIYFLVARHPCQDKDKCMFEWSRSAYHKRGNSTIPYFKFS